MLGCGGADRVRAVLVRRVGLTVPSRIAPAWCGSAWPNRWDWFWSPDPLSLREGLADDRKLCTAGGHLMQRRDDLDGPQRGHLVHSCGHVLRDGVRDVVRDVPRGAVRMVLTGA